MLTFRNSKIVYYGPHPCDNCGAAIVKMGIEFGGTAFNAPDGYPYPNTEWHPHVCDPSAVAKLRADAEKAGLESSYAPSARPSWAGTDLDGAARPYVQPPVETNHASLSPDGTIRVNYTGIVDAYGAVRMVNVNAISGQPPQRGVR